MGSAGLGWVFGCVFRIALSECASSLPGSLLHACPVPAAWPPCLIAGDYGSEDLVFGSSQLEPSLSRNHRPRSRCGGWALRSVPSFSDTRMSKITQITMVCLHTDTWQWGSRGGTEWRGSALVCFRAWGRHPKFGEFWVGPRCVRPSGAGTLEELRHDMVFQKPGRAGSFTRRLTESRSLGEDWLVRVTLQETGMSQVGSSIFL